MNESKTKRPRIKRVNSILVKDKTITLLAHFCNVSYDIAFKAYIWADDIVKQCPTEDRIAHAKNRIKLYKKGLIRKVS